MPLPPFCAPRSRRCRPWHGRWEESGWEKGARRRVRALACCCPPARRGASRAPPPCHTSTSRRCAAARRGCPAPRCACTAAERRGPPQRLRGEGRAESGARGSRHGHQGRAGYHHPGSPPDAHRSTHVRPPLPVPVPVPACSQMLTWPAFMSPVCRPRPSHHQPHPHPPTHPRAHPPRSRSLR